MIKCFCDKKDLWPGENEKSFASKLFAQYQLSGFKAMKDKEFRFKTPDGNET
jgi:hypothetical protein